MSCVWLTLALVLFCLLHFVFLQCYTTTYFKHIHKILILFFIWKALWRFEFDVKETKTELETGLLPLKIFSRAKTLLRIFVDPVSSQADKDQSNRWIYLFILRAWITLIFFFFFYFQLVQCSFLATGTFSSDLLTAKWIIKAAAFPRFQVMYKS